MAGWLDELMRDLRRIEKGGEFIDPQVAVAEGDKVLGDLSPREKALFTLVRRIQEEVGKVTEECKKQVRRNPFDPQFVKVVDELAIQCKRAQLINDIMWAEIRPRFSCRHLAIRQGFKVVHEAPPKAGDLLKALGLDDLADLGIEVDVVVPIPMPR